MRSEPEPKDTLDQDEENKRLELQHQVERLRRNEKCANSICGHSRESHDDRGCLLWHNADAAQKCLCKIWAAPQKRNVV